MQWMLIASPSPATHQPRHLRLRLTLCIAQHLSQLSTGERPFVDILQDRRYWVIHLVTIPALFIGGVTFVVTGFVYKLFSTPLGSDYLVSAGTAGITRNLVTDRFSAAAFFEV